MLEHEEKNTLRFSVDASLLFELGEQLVARKSIALSELIKNSYDSDATNVNVYFQNVTKPYGKIVVSDDGVGMSFESIKNNWMRVATNNKVENPRSPRYKRLRTGAKGVGRFAARKLANKLTIHSICNSSPGLWEETTVQLDWDKFIAGEDLNKIDLFFDRKQYSIEQTTGVTLILEDVQEVWTTDDIEEIRRDLQDLTVSFVTEDTKTKITEDGQQEKEVEIEKSRLDSDNPEVDKGFYVYITAPEFPEQEGNVNSKFYSAANAKLMAKILDDGSPEYKLRFRGSEREVKFNPKSEKLNKLIGASLVIHYFIYNTQIQEHTGIKVSEATKLGRKFGGVKIYLDGFRVFPYGDPGDDWLDLDQTRAGRLASVDGVLRNLVPKNIDRPMLNIPGNNQLFGGVLVSREDHPGLNPNISRERLLENESYYQLKRFARLGIDWLTLEWARYDTEEKDQQKGIVEEDQKDPSGQPSTKNDIDHSTKKEYKNNESKSEKNIQSDKGIETTLSDLKAKIEKITATVEPEVKEDLNTEFEKLKLTLEEKEAVQIGKISMLRILASAGSSVVIFNHQIRAVIDGLRRLVYDLGEEGQNVDIIFMSNLDQNRRRLKNWLRMLEGQAIQLGLLLGTEARRRRRQLVCRPIVEELINTFATYTESNGIEIINEVNPLLKTPPMYEAELHSLLLNIVTNALKAVKEQKERKIQIDGTNQSGYFVLRINDTGRGLSDSEKLTVFEPFVTNSAPDPVLGVGTGLGLTIVKDIVSEHSGTVKFIDALIPWKTCLEIRLPRGVDE